MTWPEILLGVVLGLLVNECCEVSPWAARRLVRWAALRRYVDSNRAEMRAEELSGLIDVRPGKLFKLVTALGFVVTAVAVCLGRGVAARTPDKIMRVARRLLLRRGMIGPWLFTDASVVLMDTSDHGIDALDEALGRGYVNKLECDWVAGACGVIDNELGLRGDSATVCVLTYHRAQAAAIRRLLNEIAPRFRNIRLQVVGTIDEAKGQESDYVIVSFCRTSRTPPHPSFGGFLRDARRFHIALTRARRTVVLVGHAPTLRRINGSDSEFAQLFTRLTDGNNVKIIRDLRWSRRSGVT